MFRLLNIELYKIYHNKASRNLIVVYFMLLTSIALISLIKFEIGPIKFNLAEQGVFDFPAIWHINTFIAALLKFFLLLVIVSMMSNEYSFKTLKQNLIDGLSKKEFLLSKFYTVIAIAAVSTIFVFILSLALGLFYSSYNEIGIISSGLEFILAFFVKLVCYFSFGLFLGILIKRSAFAIGAFIVWFVIEQIVFLILLWKLGSKSMAQEIKNFFPLEAMQVLIIEPTSRLGIVKTVSKQMELEAVNYAVTPLKLIVVLIWTVIFICLAYSLLKKRDL